MPGMELSFETRINKRERPGAVMWTISKGERIETAPAHVVSGWVGLTGRRAGEARLMAVLLPGDHVPSMEEGYGALALTRTELRPNSEAPGSTPAYLMRHCFRLGQLDAFERVADFVFETAERLRCRDWSYHMPLTQNQMGELLGLSAVHINRVLVRLRDSDLIDLKDRKVRIIEPEKVARLIGRKFEPAGHAPLGLNGKRDTEIDQRERRTE